MQKKFVLLVPLLTLWTIISPFLASPVLPHPLETPYTHPTFPLRIHSSVQSTTGLIVVGEALPPKEPADEDDQSMHSVRYLRASHSILGGVWMYDKVMSLDDIPPLVDSEGNKLGDSIYSTFVLQEAVRLINSTEKGAQNKLANGLIMYVQALGLSVSTVQRLIPLG